MDPELRSNLRRLFIEVLFEFASPALQRLWIEGHPEIMVSYTETMCGWFDDLFGVGGLAGAAEEGWLSADEVATVQRFHDVADAYVEPASGLPADILRDPRWSAVVRQALGAWQALRRRLTDPAELQLMDEHERRWGALPP